VEKLIDRLEREIETFGLARIEKIARIRPDGTSLLQERLAREFNEVYDPVLLLQTIHRRFYDEDRIKEEATGLCKIDF
jgi:hypothetical protein